MRKNTAKAIDAFRYVMPAKPAQAIWTDGDTIWSYATALVARGRTGRTVINVTRYSVTTSIHQNALRAEFPYAIEVDNMPYGATPADLFAAADMVGVSL